MMHRRRILLRRRFVLLLLRVRLVGLGRPRRLSRECHENDDESDPLLLTKCALTFFLRFFSPKKKVSSAVKKRKRTHFGRSTHERGNRKRRQKHRRPKTRRGRRRKQTFHALHRAKRVEKTQHRHHLSQLHRVRCDIDAPGWKRAL